MPKSLGRMLFCLLFSFLLGDAHWAPVTASLEAVPPFPENVTIEMYQLFDNGAPTIFRCTSGSTFYGCTAFCNNYTDLCESSQTLSYPYPSDSIDVPVETYYLLDVISQEMSPGVHELTALQAQAIAARSYMGWHLNNSVGTNNSNERQVFIPYKFDSLNPTATPLEPDVSTPCDSDTLNDAQRNACDAIAVRYYITRSDTDLPAFAEFSADAYLHTVTNVTDRDEDGQFDFPYLTGVDDPISYDPAILDIIAATGAHQRGMSQGGANRWARGNSSQYGTGEPWAVAWTDYRQILCHYYTGVDLKNASGTDQMPPYRWLGLWHDIPPDLEPDQTHLVTIVVQNSGVNIWYADSTEEQNVALSHQLVGLGGACLHNCDALVRHSLPHDVAPGEVITLTPTIYLPSIRPCDLTLRWDMVLLSASSQTQVNAPAISFWFYEQWPAWYPLDIPLVECPYHVYLPFIKWEPDHDQVSVLSEGNKP